MNNRILFLSLLLFMSFTFVSCGGDDNDVSNPSEDNVSLYKQKIVGQWAITAIKYKSSTNFEVVDEAYLLPNFKSDGSLVYINNPSSSHKWEINNNLELVIYHNDSHTSENLNIKFEDNYNILILGPDILGTTQKYKRSK